MAHATTSTRSFRRSYLTLAAAALLGAVAAAPAAALPQITPYDANGPIAGLRLGDDLWAGVDGLSASTSYNLRLVAPVVGQLALQPVTSDALGRVAPVLLWLRSGVVGCDAGAQPNNVFWRFERYEDAELKDGKMLKIQVRTVPGNLLVTELDLQVLADPTIPRFYVSDANACPRFLNEGTGDLYLSGLHLEDLVGKTKVLYTFAAAWPVSPPMVDLRTNFPNGQIFTIPAIWEGVTLTTIVDTPLFFFWATVQSTDWDPLTETPTCPAHPTRYLPSGTGTPATPICPPCTNP